MHAVAVLYNGTTYYYATSIQGDVIAILNNAGTAVVQYAYDAWGNPISTTGTMASTLGVTNPLRYRSYIYDTEYDLYYLQSRYYDPEVGRFLNADAFTATGQGILGNNMFAYCQNNPISFLDPSGYCRCVGPNDIKIVDCGSFTCKMSDSYRYYANSPQYADSCADALGSQLGVLLLDWMYELEFFEDWVGTFSIGITAGCMGGPGGTISLAIVFDSEGNIGLEITPAVGAGIFAAGITGFVSITNTNNIRDLSGYSRQFGGAILAGGYEHSWFEGAVTKKAYQGHSLLLGPVSPFPGETHFTVGYSFVIPFGNVRR